jgi:hypothetical protein
MDGGDGLGIDEGGGTTMDEWDGVLIDYLSWATMSDGISIISGFLWMKEDGTKKEEIKVEPPLMK